MSQYSPPSPPNPYSPYNQPNQPPYNQPNQPPYNQPNRFPLNGFGITALVTGIVGLVLFWVPGLGVVLGILAVVFGVLGYKAFQNGKANNKGLSVAGFVMGALVVLGAVITMIVIFTAASSANDYYNSPYARCMANPSTSYSDCSGLSHEG